MIDLYYWPTPNGHKASIMLEETGLKYTVKPVNILKGEQFAADFLALSPNNKIPAMVDHEGPGGETLSIFESGAMLIYLAEKSGQFLPSDHSARFDVLQWLMFQVASIGPMFGQCGHFLGYAPEPIHYAIDRYRNETLRLYQVMDQRLATAPYLAGEYSIADIATWPWVDVRWLHNIDISQFPHVERWYQEIGKRPGVQRGRGVMAEDMVIGNPSDETREVFFGATQTHRQ